MSVCTSAGQVDSIRLYRINAHVSQGRKARGLTHADRLSKCTAVRTDPAIGSQKGGPGMQRLKGRLNRRRLEAGWVCRSGKGILDIHNIKYDFLCPL